MDDNAVQFVIDARGARTEYRYNARGLPTYIEFSAPAGVAHRDNIFFDYDAAGNRKWMAELGFGRVDYEYDTLSRLKSETRRFDGVADSFKLEYGYDVGGRLTSVTNPWGISVGYARDRAGRVTHVTNGGYGGFGNYTNDIRYRASGAVKSKALGNGLNYTAQFDKRMRLKSWSVPLAQGGGMGSEYGYDNFNENTGRVTYARNIYDPALDRSYRYDHVGRLMHSLSGQEARQHALGESRERIDGDYGQAYHYDTRGNLTFRDGWGGAGQLAAVTYDAKNQRPGQVHDAAGNMTSDGYTSFAYDATGRETSASSGVTHTYDGDLTRIKRVENGQTTLYLRSSVMGGAVVAEMNATGAWTRGYVYGESGSLTAMQQPEGYVEWVTADPVTKGQRITNASGQVTAALEFDPFGGETSKSVNSYRQPQKYTTYTRDANGTDDAMHRRYIAYWSRFQQPDPYDGSYNLADPQSLNRYAYVNNDPVNLVDPSGLNASSGMWTPGVGGYGCDASYGSCGGGWDGTGGGGGGGGFGFSGGLFDSERFNPGSAGEAAYAQRLQNTYDAIDANRALRQYLRSEGSDTGAASLFASIMARNSSLYLQVQPRSLSARGALDHYMGGSGETLRIPFSDLGITDSFSILIFSEVMDIFRAGKGGAFRINSVAVYDTNSLVIGNLALRLEGTLRYRKDFYGSEYSFTGSLSAAVNDRYDFNRANRSAIKESITWVGRQLPGAAYNIEVVGSRSIRVAYFSTT